MDLQWRRRVNLGGLGGGARRGLSLKSVRLSVGGLILALIAAPASAAYAQGTAAPAGRPSNKKVLIIGTDGTRPDKLEAANIPNIRALMATGAYTAKAHTRMPTVSGPGWSSLLTGVWSDKHGVKNNDLSGNNYAQYPDLLTRLEKINPAFSTFAAADWPPILSGRSGGPIISDETDVKLSFRNDSHKNDQLIANLASFYLSREKVDAAFVYFGRVDEVGHDLNPLSPQYTAAIEAMDKQVGQVLQAIRSRATYAQEDWLILMSTDHGHVDKGGHGGPSEVERNIFVLANGPNVAHQTLPDDTEIVDVGVTALAHLGVAIDPTWSIDGKVLALRRPSSVR